MPNSVEEDDLADEYRRHGKKFTRALEMARARHVKRHRFKPSGRVIWTVVGREGDQMVNPAQPYCSCRHFHYRVVSGKDETCYHLLSAQIAQHLGVYDDVEFQDSEYASLLKALIQDIFWPVRRDRAALK